MVKKIKKPEITYYYLMSFSMGPLGEETQDANPIDDYCNSFIHLLPLINIMCDCSLYQQIWALGSKHIEPVAGLIQRHV